MVNLRTIIDIPGYQGRAVWLDSDCTFRIYDVEGCQIADMFVISAVDHHEVFSPAMTRNLLFKLTAQCGDVLYSNRRQPMLTFIDDTSPGRHDMAFAPCDPGFYIELGGDASHPNCRDNFHQAISKLDIKIEQAPDPFNLFQNTVPKIDGNFETGKTLTEAGDYVEFRADMDVILVVTACSADLPINGIHAIGGRSTPLRLEVL